LVNELKSLGLSVELVEKQFAPAAEPRKESERREVKKVRIRT